MQEEPKNQNITQPAGSKKPAGLVILGWLNLSLFGAMIFILFAGFIYSLSPEIMETFAKAAKEGGFYLQFTQKQLRMAMMIQLLIASIYIISGAGLLKVKEWARRLIVYFSFFRIVIVFLNVILMPAMAGLGIIEAVYPAILVAYFTNKNVVNYFKTARDIIKPFCNHDTGSG